MKMKNLLLVLILLSSILNAQTSITGTVSDENNQALPGVNIHFIKSNLGTISDIEGHFTIKSTLASDTLVFSFIGYKPVLISNFSQQNLIILLQLDSDEIDEVVLTAFGISRAKKSIGYAVDEINSENINANASDNIIKSLTGKIAGLQINETSGGEGSSTRIVLRGSRYLGSNNQALIVVDGIPINNTTRGTGGTWGGIDFGSGISDVNADDIESISILKGPNAAALYGSRASNGVILIKTKKAQTNNKINLSYSSSIELKKAAILNEFQNSYGAGSNGQFEYKHFTSSDSIINEDGTYTYFEAEDSIPEFNTGYYGKSWGPLMLGQSFIDWDGVVRHFEAQENNYKDFYQTGTSFQNSFSIDKSDEESHIRFSYSNLKSNSISPNSSFQRDNISLRAGTEINSKIKIDSKVSYSRQHALNRLNQSDGRGSARHFNLMPRSISLASLENYSDASGNEQIWYTPWPWISNPYWMAYENKNEDIKDRWISYLSSTLELSDWLQLKLRAGFDTYTERRYNRIATGSFQNPFGEYAEYWGKFKELNSDFLFIAKRNLNNDIKVQGSFGGNRMYNQFEELYAKNARLAEAYFYDLEHSELPIEVSNQLFEKKINSLYGTGQFEYKSYLFFDFSLRNDWSSTLPKQNNSYLYPSYNIAYIFSEGLDLESNTINFGKLRASWAKVGSDGDPYSLQLAYSSEGAFNGLPLASVNQIMPNPNLLPMFTRSSELGLDLNLFNNKLGVQSTYYHSTTNNQILQADISDASGFSHKLGNVGTVLNRGIECSLNINLLDIPLFDWNTTLNLNTNKNEIVELSNDLENYIIASHWGITIEARPGNAYGDIVGVSIAKDADGNRLLDESGMYIKGERKVLGNISPKYNASLSQSISVHSIQFNFLVDLKMGGDIYSATNMYGMGYSGNYIQTLEGRDEWYASESEREAQGISPDEWQATGGYLADGVYQNGSSVNGEDMSGQINQTYINPELYWGQFSEWGNEIHELHVYDASYIKLREFNISYKFSKTIAEKFGMQSLSCSLYARNLWLLYSNVPNIDPESTYSNGNGQGLEYGSYPTSRTYGLTLKALF